MKFLKVMNIGEARSLIEDHFGHTPCKSVTVGIDDALFGVVKKDYYGKEDLPGFNRSTVDGYAVVSSDTFGAGEAVPSLLSLAGKVEMGKKAEVTVKIGQAVYVPTGGEVPSGADAVVMIEDTDIIKGQEGDMLAVFKPCAPGTNIIFKGDDIKTGELLMKAGRVITPLDIGVLAAAGIAEIEIYKPLRFFVISTGDEIVEITESQREKIRDVNGHVIEALLKESGQEVVKRVIIPDDFDAIKRAVQEGLDLADAVILSGGSSAGDKDYTHDVINSFDDVPQSSGVLVHGLALKPGKPTVMGKVRNKPVFGLPGHPASAVIVFKLLIDFYIQMVQGCKPGSTVKAKMGFNVHSSPGKLSCQTVRLTEEDGVLTAMPVYGKSGLIKMLSDSDGYVQIPEHMEGLSKGDLVEVWLL